MKKTQKLLLKLFLEKGWKQKPDGLTWDQIGQLLDTSGESVRAAWKRYRFDKAVETVVTTTSAISTPKFKSDAKVLIFDLETSPNLSWTWRTWKENINYNQILQEWFILTFSAKWLWEDKIISARLTADEVKNEDDSRIVKLLWELVNEADIIVAHNLIGFDQKRMNTRFLLNGLEVPKPYQTIDTLLHARKHLAFVSNRLDALGQILGVGKKVDTGGFELWKQCMKGDEEALAKMEVYNIGDVKLLEDVYTLLINYIKPHPNIGLLQPNGGKLLCATCGSDDLHEHGEYYTTVSVFQAYKCGNCGSLSRSRKQILKDKEHVTVSIPK